MSEIKKLRRLVHRMFEGEITQQSCGRRQGVLPQGSFVYTSFLKRGAGYHLQRMGQGEAAPLPAPSTRRKGAGMIETHYTVEEAAKILRRTKNSIYKLISSRQLAAVRGRPVLIPESAIKEFLNKKKQRALR